MRGDWEVIDHCCRACFSRLLRRPIEGSSPQLYQFMCSGCGASGDGDHPRAICSCGMTLRNGKNLGVRCVVNDKVSPEVPFQIVARQVDQSGR
jgi:hypothetical protein